MTFRRNSLILIVLVFLFACSSNQIKNQTSNSSADSHTQLSFLKVEKDYGVIDSSISIIQPSLDISRYKKDDIKQLFQKLLLNDQMYRDRVMTQLNSKRQKLNDSINQVLLPRLIDKIGVSNLGKLSNEEINTLFLIIWHA